MLYQYPSYFRRGILSGENITLYHLNGEWKLDRNGKTEISIRSSAKHPLIMNWLASEPQKRSIRNFKLDSCCFRLESSK